MKDNTNITETMGKVQLNTLDTPKTEEKKINTETEAVQEEAPKKKKNIIRVYHAQNASDGGKRKRPAGERPVRPGVPGERKPVVRGADGRPVRPAGERPARPAGERPVRPAGERPAVRKQSARYRLL